MQNNIDPRRRLLCDLIVAAGGGLAAVGAGLVFLPAGLIVGGVACVLFGLTMIGVDA